MNLKGTAYRVFAEVCPLPNCLPPGEQYRKEHRMKKGMVEIEEEEWQQLLLLIHSNPN